MTTSTTIDWRAIAEAILTPTAVRILELAAERGEIAAKDVHEDLGEGTLSNVSYHVRRLRDLELLEEAREERVRGAVQIHYRLTGRTS